MPTPNVPLAIVGRLVALGVVLLGFFVGVRACSVTVPDRDELAASLVDSGLPADVASCAADALYDHLSEDELRSLAERGGGGAPVDDPERDDDSADQVREAMVECRAKLDASTTTTVAPDDGGAGGGADDDGASTDATGSSTTP